MAERNRSNDKSKDSDKILGAKDTPSQQGRSGGGLQRDIAARDEEKRSQERPAGVTRVTKSDEREKGDS